MKSATTLAFMAPLALLCCLSILSVEAQDDDSSSSSSRRTSSSISRGRPSSTSSRRTTTTTSSSSSSRRTSSSSSRRTLTTPSSRRTSSTSSRRTSTTSSSHTGRRTSSISSRATRTASTASVRDTAGASASAANAAHTGGSSEGSDVWTWTGAQSVYWHTRYHGCLAMAAYGDYNSTCPDFFTRETLQRQYPGNTNRPFEVVGEWGPTEVYRSEGFMVRVPEMNKILMVFKGVYGWENFDATLSPLLGVGCNATCMAHTGAIEAWAEVKAATNDMEVIKRRQGDLVWSASGHGFGGMIMQVAALDLKSRNFLFSAQSFGSPPVFNEAAARRWDDLFVGDASQRTVANSDAVPAKIPYRNKELEDGTLSDSPYVFVNTGIHVWNNASIRETPMGSSNMYGQNYVYCLGDNEDPRCAGGDSEEDHYFYFTDMGTCCEAGWTARYNATFDREALMSDQEAYSLTATEPLQDVPDMTPDPTTTAVSSTSTLTQTVTGPSSTASSQVGSGIGLNNNENAPTAIGVVGSAPRSARGDTSLVIALVTTVLLAVAGAAVF